MPLILHIETSSPVCSVCISQNSKLLAQLDTKERNAHSSVITGFIEKLLSDQGLDLSKLNAVAISGGPGSYTGLRIGAATAKGLCYSLDIPLISVSTLMAMAYVKATDFTEDYLLHPMVDARREEVYTALYTKNLEVLIEPDPIVLNMEYLDDFSDRKIVIFGSGAEKAKKYLDYPGLEFETGFSNYASDMVYLANEKYKLEYFEDIAYFEPDYLKPFFTG